MAVNALGRFMRGLFIRDDRKWVIEYKYSCRLAMVKI